MKRKIFAAVLAVVMLVSVFAVSASAEFTFNTKKETCAYYSAWPSLEQFETFLDLAELLNEMGFVAGGCDSIIIYESSYASNGRYIFVAFVDSSFITSVDATGNKITFTFSSPNNTLYNFPVYYWSGSSLNYTNSIHYYNKTLSYYSLIYVGSCSLFEQYIPNLIGFNSTLPYGTSDWGFDKALAYYSTMYDYLVNHDRYISDATLAGQQYGVLLGKQQCEATHSDEFQAAFDAGRDEGYSNCEKTHQAIKDEGYGDGFSDGLSQGAMNGYADCQATHPALLKEAQDEGYAAGDADGYMRGLLEGGQNKQEELDLEYWRGRSDGYDYGYTQALESSDVVLDYVDGIFSAPINFLYRAFNIEILGINLFNVLMLFLSLFIVGGVVLLVLKFR